MPLPIDTSTIDSVTGYAVPLSTGTWAGLANAVTWGSWTSWNNQAANSMVVVGNVQDRGKTGYFNIKTSADVIGNISYQVFTSNNGAFAGEEMITNVSPNTSNLNAFYGRYYSVVANVTDPAGQIQLRSLNVTSTDSRFDIQFNDVDTSALEAGPNNSGSRVLPLNRTISAVTNMQVSSHNPSVSSSVYINTGNYGYTLEYNGTVGTTLASQLSQVPAFTQYAAFAVGSDSPNIKVYKTLNGTEWIDTTATFSNSVAGLAESISWSYDGTILVFASQNAANGYQRIRGYSRSGDSFTKLPDPDVWPAGVVHEVKWARTADDYCAVAHNNSPYITLYKKSGINYVKENDPATLPTGDAYALAWTADDSFLAVGHQTSPRLTVYYRSGNTFTKLANPTSLPSSDVYDVTWDPTGRWLFCTTGVTDAQIKIYYRAGTGASSTLIAIDNPATVPAPATGLMVADWNTSGNAVAIAWSSNVVVANVASPRWGVYRVDGNTFTWANTVSTLSDSVLDIQWGASDTQIYVGHQKNDDNPEKGFTAYDFNYSTNIATPLTSASSNVGNVYALSTTTAVYNNFIEVANASAFTSGNIRVRNETMSYTSANTSGTPHRLEGIVRAVTTSEFGTSSANTHASGSEVFQIDNIDFTQRYFATTAVGIASAYVGDKDRVYPTVVVRGAEGEYTDGVVDVVMWVLPEQYMDDTNLGTR